MSICIECAVRNHEFRESVDGVSSPAGLREGLLGKAWIDGKKYRLRHVRPYHLSCQDCHRVGGILYFLAR